MDKLEFVKSLAEEYLRRWRAFAQRRTSELEKTLQELEKLIEKVKKPKKAFLIKGDF